MTLDIKAIKARCEAATRGPWVREPIGGRFINGATIWAEGRRLFGSSLECTESDFSFIANARKDVPDLVAAYEEKAARVEELEKSLSETLDSFEDSLGYINDYYRDKWGYDKALDEGRKVLNDDK